MGMSAKDGLNLLNIPKIMHKKRPFRAFFVL
jgi:hypothetical protein